MLGLGYDPARINTVGDARRMAKRRLPRMVFDYADGAADGEITMAANRTAFEEVRWVPRMATTHGQPELATTVLGSPVSMPLLLSPCGLARMFHRDGDEAVARAAGGAGTLFTLSCMSGHRLEDVAAAASGPRWFQLYFLGGRAGAEQLIDRAQRAGFGALAVTVDTQQGGNRERDARNGLRRPLGIDLRNTVEFLPQVAPKLRWLRDFARDGFRLDLPNASSLSRDGVPLSLDEAQAAMSATPPRWEDFAWIREQWKGPVIVKGILSVDDAKRAVDVGASAVIVSNHGGRQLDTVSPTLRALVRVVEAVGDQIEVYMDGGVRRGADVAKVVALGGRAAMVGRPWVYSLGAAGEAGVAQILAQLKFDLLRNLRLLGCPSVSALDRSWVELPEHRRAAGTALAGPSGRERRKGDRAGTTLRSTPQRSSSPASPTTCWPRCGCATWWIPRPSSPWRWTSCRRWRTPTARCRAASRPPSWTWRPVAPSWPGWVVPGHGGSPPSTSTSAT